MRGVTLITLVVCVAQAYDTDAMIQALGQESNLDKLADSLVSKLYGRVLEAAPFQDEDVDDSFPREEVIVVDDEDDDSLVHVLGLRGGAKAMKAMKAMKAPAMKAPAMKA